MGKDLNKVMLTGHLGADPEMRYTPQGSAVTTFRVASGRSWKSSDGSAHEETEWFRIVAWDKLGEICNQYLTKGTRVYVEGRLRTNKWQDKETGQDRYSTEVIASDMIILSSRQDRQAAGGDYEAPTDEDAPAPARRAAQAPTPAAPAAPRPANGAGASRPAAAARPAARNVPQMIDSDEDLPF
ncbi:MAG: single-stranded DNA-binding protein [Kouleothrix sp.]|jgi:single-strand DNA-binding protein|nr:single-stranded DNA-binding protein [Kouleothrix sp.]